MSIYVCCTEEQTGCLAYGDVYQPNLFGSSGGGQGGGRGGGRIWLNVTNTIHIDGSLTANGEDGKTVDGKLGGGGSGGSIWLHCDTVNGFGLIQVAGGRGSFGDINVERLISQDGLETQTCETQQKCSNGVCQEHVVCTKTICDTTGPGATCTDTTIDSLPLSEMRCAGQVCSNLCNNHRVCAYDGITCATREVCCSENFSECCYDSLDVYYDRQYTNWANKHVCCHDDPTVQFGEVCCHEGSVHNGTQWTQQKLCCHQTVTCSGAACTRNQVCCDDNNFCTTQTTNTWTTTTTSTTPIPTMNGSITLINSTLSTTVSSTTSTSTTTQPPTTTPAARTYTFTSEIVTSGGGGGGGGRFAMYFWKNMTFSEFRYLANGGHPGRECDECEAGGPGTVFLYHMGEKHRTLIIDNDGAASPRDKYVNWDNVHLDGGRAWILPISGVHPFATGTSGSYAYEFEELQIYGNGHLAVLPPNELNVDVGIDDVTDLGGGVDKRNYNVIIFFKYMIGDRSGSVHVADRQAMDLQREEIDLPFNTYTYYGSYLGLAPSTFVHGVEIHLAGFLANVNNITLRLGGYLWLKHGGHTTQEPESHYKFDYVKIQDDSVLNATTDPIAEPGITFYIEGFTIEGGGVMHGTYVTLNAKNVTIDAGGHMSSNGLGYRFEHSHSSHGSISVHGAVNPGAPDVTFGIAGGAGHGGSGGKDSRSGARAGFAYGDIYQPTQLGSSGGASVNGAPGGSGGGVFWLNVTEILFIDGLVSSNGADGVNGSAGGSGGSVWIHCDTIKGYGKIVAHGGDGSTYPDSSGSGGAGGRVAVYFNVNKTMSEFRYLAYGGAKGGPDSENGGSGTSFVYNKVELHRTIIVDNNGRHPRHEHNIIGDYRDLTYDSARTWILPESGYNTFANGKFEFHFEEIQIYGAAHLAVLPEPVGTVVDLFFTNMIGDRTGTVHLGDGQVMDLRRPEIDLPFNCRVYAGAFLGLAPMTFVHGVTIWLHGEMDHVENLTLHHDGHLALQTGGFTTGDQPDRFRFLWVRIQDNATISILTDPVSDPQSQFKVINTISMEGGSNFVVTNTKIETRDLILDYGASLHADGTGYRADDPKTTTVNVGVGHSSIHGSSGGGYGGSSGWGAGTPLTGQPHGHLFQPYHLGSAGGGGWESGGQGGGKIILKVLDLLMVDGEIRANGADGRNHTGGGGSGGTVMITTINFRGMGNITANGGGRYVNGVGGGGSGGRIALYFRHNVTYWGGFQCHGGHSAGTAEPGGPGPVFLYNVQEEHSTLYVNNNNLRTPTEVNLIRDYTDISRDRFKAWVMPESSDHRLAGTESDYRFDELQIYGNAHLALLPEPYDGGCSLHFQHMIGDRSGFIHIGPYQVMDLNRPFLDTPFSSFVYDGGYLGLAPDTFLEGVFAHIEGTVDHIHNLTLVQGGGLRLFKTGSTNNLAPLTYQVLGLTIIKAESYINCSNPNADTDAYQLTFGWTIVEGGGVVRGGNLHIMATDFTIDDGGQVDVSDGGFRPNEGPGKNSSHVWNSNDC